VFLDVIVEVTYMDKSGTFLMTVNNGVGHTISAELRSEVNNRNILTCDMDGKVSKVNVHVNGDVLHLFTLVCILYHLLYTTV